MTAKVVILGRQGSKETGRQVLLIRDWGLGNRDWGLVLMIKSAAADVYGRGSK